jgi:hypothetical protein
MAFRILTLIAGGLSLVRGDAIAQGILLGGPDPRLVNHELGGHMAFAENMAGPLTLLRTGQ